MILFSKNFMSFSMNMHVKDRRPLPYFLTTLTRTHSSAVHCQHMLTTERKFNFMTHLKYQHLNADILFIGIAAAIIPLLGKEKFKGIYTFLEFVNANLTCGTCKG